MKRAAIYLLVGVVVGVAGGFALGRSGRTPEHEPYRPILKEILLAEELNKVSRRTWRLHPNMPDSSHLSTYDIGSSRGETYSASRRYFAQTEMPYGGPDPKERREFLNALVRAVREAIVREGAELGRETGGDGTDSAGKYASMQWHTGHYSRGPTSGVVHIVLTGDDDDTVTLFFAVDEAHVVGVESRRD